MRDKNDAPLVVGDLVISDFKTSAGQIYRIDTIENCDVTAYRQQQGRTMLARCSRVRGRFLNEEETGGRVTWGDDVIKLTPEFARNMAKKWAALAEGLCITTTLNIE